MYRSRYKKQNISLRFPLMSAKSATAVDELAGSRASDETSSVCHSVLMAANMSSPLFLSCRRVTTLDRNRPDASCNQKKRGTIVTKTTPVDFKIKKNNKKDQAAFTGHEAYILEFMQRTEKFMFVLSCEQDGHFHCKQRYYNTISKVQIQNKRLHFKK